MLEECSQKLMRKMGGLYFLKELMYLRCVGYRKHVNLDSLLASQKAISKLLTNFEFKYTFIVFHQGILIILKQLKPRKLFLFVFIFLRFRQPVKTLKSVFELLLND